MIIVHVHGDDTFCDVYQDQAPPGLSLTAGFARLPLNDGEMLFAADLEALLANVDLPGSPTLREGLVDQGLVGEDERPEDEPGEDDE